MTWTARLLDEACAREQLPSLLLVLGLDAYVKVMDEGFDQHDCLAEQLLAQAWGLA